MDLTEEEITKLAFSTDVKGQLRMDLGYQEFLAHF